MARRGHAGGFLHFSPRVGEKKKKNLTTQQKYTRKKKRALNRADNYKEQQPRESAGEAKRGWETTYLGRLMDTLKKKMFSLEYTKQ